MTAKSLHSVFICGKQSKWYIKRKANNALFVVTQCPFSFPLLPKLSSPIMRIINLTGSLAESWRVAETERRRETLVYSPFLVPAHRSTTDHHFCRFTSCQNLSFNRQWALFALIVVIMRAADLAAPSELLMMRRPLWQVLFPGDWPLATDTATAYSAYWPSLRVSLISTLAKSASITQKNFNTNFNQN